jgi:hypothetical protein
MFHMKSYTLKELAAHNNVSPKVFRKQLEPYLPLIGEKAGWYYTVRQVKIIVEKLGLAHYYDFD